MLWAICAIHEVDPVRLPRPLLSDLPETLERQAAYGLLSRLMAQAGVGPIDRLVKDDLGRPFDPGQTGLNVSVSHTRGVVGAAVAVGRRVGIDVEAMSSYDREVAKMVLTDAERRWVEQCARPDDAFIRLWVRKEAIGKALGVGIDDPILALDAREDMIQWRGSTLRLTDLPERLSAKAALAVDPVVRTMPKYIVEEPGFQSD